MASGSNDRCTFCHSLVCGRRLILEHENWIISEHTNSQKHRQQPLYTEIYRKNATAKNLGPHFVQACTGEMHVNISQETLYTEIYRKTSRPEPRTTLCASLRNRNALRRFTRVTLYGNLQEKCCAPESAQAQNADALCERLRRRIAFQHFTRAA